MKPMLMMIVNADHPSSELPPVNQCILSMLSILFGDDIGLLRGHMIRFKRSILRCGEMAGLTSWVSVLHRMSPGTGDYRTAHITTHLSPIKP